MESSADFPELSTTQAMERRSGVKLTRIHSSKYRKASTKKLVASADQTTRLRRSRSIRLSRQSSRIVLRSVARPVIKKDSRVNRPTCSSAIKGSKSIGHCLDGRDPGCDFPEKTSAAEVCPYSYCSLHGHRHAAAAASPSLKRMKSSRKRVAARGKKSEARLPFDRELNKETDSSFTGKNDASGDKERKGDYPQPPREVEIPDSRTGVAFSSTIGGRKYTVLWMLIHENMISDIASETPIRGNVMRGMEYAASNDTESESGTTVSTPDEQMGLCQGDVVMLLQGALDKLLLEQRSNQSSDNQSVGNDRDLSGASSCSELKNETESGANTPRALQNDEGSSNRWSRLRKLILMKRFIKALEKTRRFNPRMRQGQKSEAGPEAEVVNLRRPLIGERKKSEEWMLDHALREVVSRLDTDQQRSVSLLIEAFEKLSPMQGDSPISGHKASSRLRSKWDQPEDMGCFLESDYKSTMIDSSPASLEQNVELFESEQKNEEASMDDPESCALAPENDSEWGTEEPTASVSASSSDPEIGNSVEAVDEAPYTDDGLEDRTESPTRELVGPDNGPDVDVPYGTELGRGKNNGLWSLIYAHMVSDIEENSEGRLTVRGTEASKTEDGNLGGDLNDAVISNVESESDRDTTASTPDGQSEICQSDAVKLLQEALGKLLQQQEADQSFGGRADADNGTVNERTGNSINGNDTRAPEKPVSSNRWCRLKKLILLKRFVRAVEKTKKLDPKLRRRHQRPEVYPDVENVSLRRQSIEERKRSEEWMLDYALRQAVSKLDQEQKKRVSLLVEAFEKMSPAQGSIPADNPNSRSVFHGESLLSSVVDEERNTLVSKHDGESKKKEHGTDLCPDPREMSRTVEEPLEAHSENKRYTKLWYMVYQHMVSGLEAEQGPENASPDRTYTPCSRQSSPDQHAEGMELEKIETVRLVQEAIDGILISEGGEDSINDQSRAEDQPEDAVEEKEETESKPEGKLDDRGGGAKKNWNNLKKVILIKRFVKSLEKVRKLDGPRQKPGRVSLHPKKDQTRMDKEEEEEERVRLRRRDTDERKNAEEWMLDYAMRRVVSELTPERKRKVKLLAEAFESVAPPAPAVGINSKVLLR